MNSSWVRTPRVLHFVIIKDAVPFASRELVITRVHQLNGTQHQSYVDICGVHRTIIALTEYVSDLTDIICSPLSCTILSSLSALVIFLWFLSMRCFFSFLKTPISIVVYLDTYNPLIVILCFFISSYWTFYALFYVFCILCISLLFHLVKVCECYTEY